jgi:hypothetical protein
MCTILIGGRAGLVRGHAKDRCRRFGGAHFVGEDGEFEEVEQPLLGKQMAQTDAGGVDGVGDDAQRVLLRQHLQRPMHARRKVRRDAHFHRFNGAAEFVDLAQQPRILAGARHEAQVLIGEIDALAHARCAVFVVPYVTKMRHGIAIGVGRVLGVDLRVAAHDVVDKERHPLVGLSGQSAQRPLRLVRVVDGNGVPEVKGNRLDNRHSGHRHQKHIRRLRR